MLTHLEGRLAFVLGSWDYLEVCDGSDNDALILEALGASVKCLTAKARPSYVEPKSSTPSVNRDVNTLLIDLKEFVLHRMELLCTHMVRVLLNQRDYRFSIFPSMASCLCSHILT